MRSQHGGLRARDRGGACSVGLAELVHVDRGAARVGLRALCGLRPARRRGVEQCRAAGQRDAPRRARRRGRRGCRRRWPVRDLAARGGHHRGRRPGSDRGRVRDGQPAHPRRPGDGGGRRPDLARSRCRPARRGAGLPALARLHARGDDGARCQSVRARLAPLGSSAHRRRLSRRVARRLRRHGVAQAQRAGGGPGGNRAATRAPDVGFAQNLRRACAGRRPARDPARHPDVLLPGARRGATPSGLSSPRTSCF
jgi:hypothetical protein